MLENPSDSTAAAVKRYAPPNQRNRSLGRRKSGGDKLERANSITNDAEKNQVPSLRNLPILNHMEPRGSNISNATPTSGLIPLQGICNSEAYRLLNNRWVSAMDAYANPSTDEAERPIMYSGNVTSAWGQFRLPHQLVGSTAAGGTSGLQMDFLGELRKAIRNARPYN